MSSSSSASDPYIRVRQLGQGSFGRVLLVRDRRDGQLAVMKEVDLQQFGAKGRQEAMKEVAFLNQLSHPYIISYKEFFERSPPGSGGGSGNAALPPPLGKDGKPDPQWDTGAKNMLFIIMEVRNHALELSSEQARESTRCRTTRCSCIAAAAAVWSPCLGLRLRPILRRMDQALSAHSRAVLLSLSACCAMLLLLWFLVR